MSTEQSQTFLFADLAGFSALTEAHGDEEAADLVGEFVAAIRAQLPDYGAVEIKCIGDAMMIRCPRADRAVELGLRIVASLGDRPGFPSVRVGMSTGTAVERDGDWFGATVNLAARVSGAAAGGETLLTESTSAAAGEMAHVQLESRGRLRFKNVAEPVRLYAATAAGKRSAAGLPIDPVCRMAVDPERSVGALRHHGVRYVFCSLDCVNAFARDPERYAAAIGTKPPDRDGNG